MLSLRQIEVFHAVMVSGSVSGAARMLNVSQPGLSRLIKYMEQRVGFRLFERRAGRLVATPEAHRLFMEVDLIYQRVGGLDQSIRRIAEGEGHELAVGASPSVGRSLVPRALAELSGTMPGTIARLEILPMNQVQDYLLAGAAEQVVTIFPFEHPLVESQFIGAGRLVCAFRPDHPLAGIADLTVADIAPHGIVAFEPGSPHAQVIESVFSDAGVKPRIAGKVRFAQTACALAESGLGVALVDAFTVMGKAFPDLAVRPLHGTSLFRVELHRHRHLAQSMAGARFAAALRGAMAQAAREDPAMLLAA